MSNILKDSETHISSCPEKVIIVKGIKNRGKSTTLRCLIELLKNSSSLINNDKNEGDKSNSERDCFAILDVSNFGKVGVITFGDKGNEPNVEKCLDTCVSSGCRAVVAASHTQERKGSIYAMLLDFGRKHNAKTVDTNTYVHYECTGRDIGYTHLNKICAENLLNLLLKL